MPYKQTRLLTPASLFMMGASAICLSLSGCATDGYVGVSTFPDYSPYYGYYGYSGIPFYGYGGIYRRNIIIRGRGTPAVMAGITLAGSSVTYSQS